MKLNLEELKYFLTICKLTCKVAAVALGLMLKDTLRMTSDFKPSFRHLMRDSTISSDTEQKMLMAGVISLQLVLY